MKFVYSGNAEQAARRSHIRTALMLLIGLLVIVVGVLVITKKQVFPGILVIFFGVVIAGFSALRFAQINNLLKTVRKSVLEITEEGVTGTGFLIKSGLCLPAQAELAFDDIKSVKSHTPNERSFDYATIEVRTQEEAYFFSVDEADRAIIEIRLHIKQK